MSVLRLIAIAVIFFCTSIAWVILGVSSMSRTGDSHNKLQREVENLFGTSQSIKKPVLFGLEKRQIWITNEANGKISPSQENVIHPLSLASSKIDVDVRLDRRRKGVLWFPTYRFTFEAKYVFEDRENEPNERFLDIALDNEKAIYDDIVLEIDGVKHEDVLPLLTRRSVPIALHRKKHEVKLSFRSTGMQEINYLITPRQGDLDEINHFALKIKTDFEAVDFPDDSISPTKKTKTGEGWELEWAFEKTATGKDIGLVIPNRLNPGEIIPRVTFFAPVPLLFYFFILIIFSVLEKTPLHPMNYFFLAATFFAFHLMFSYFSDQMNLYLAFGIAAVVSVFLASSYLRLFTPTRFAYVVSGTAQMIYLISFSFSFFY
ncbi:MAG: hypothetical protein JNM63_06325, partial [Spirochaetia bacterium]|nr:hypothetical protein [Spirochaetia bacterium]